MSRYVYGQNPASRRPQAEITPADHYAAARQLQSTPAIILLSLAIILFALGFDLLFFEPDGLLVQSPALIGEAP